MCHGPERSAGRATWGKTAGDVPLGSGLGLSLDGTVGSLTWCLRLGFFPGMLTRPPERRDLRHLFGINHGRVFSQHHTQVIPSLSSYLKLPF